MRTWLALLGLACADWIAWKADEPQGDPTEGLWQPVPRAQRFQAFDWELDPVNSYRFFFKGATHYTLGNASAELQLEFWQPFTEDHADSAVCANIRAALFNLHRQNLSSVHITIRNVGWDGVAERPLCETGAACPNVILLGSSQLPPKVVADRLQPLNDYMKEYLRAKLERLQDDFPSVTYYQYFSGANWMGIPFLSDVRLIAFNKTTLLDLRLDLPPPWGFRQDWSWEDLKHYACKVKAQRGTPGLLGNSDFDEEFKFFTLQVQSGGGSLYKVVEGDLRCSLNESEGVAALESFWRPMILDKCLRSLVRGPYWHTSGESLEEVLGPIDPLDPPDVKGFSNYDYHRENMGFEGFVLSSGFDERLTVGNCEKEDAWHRPWLKCKQVGHPLAVNLTRCKEEMLLAEADTLTHADQSCRLLKCPTKEDALALRLPNLVVYSKFCSEILYADMPANHTFLGGSGLVIPKEAGKRHVCSSETDEAACLRQRHGWEMILELADTKQPYMQQANLLKQQSVPPPRRSLAELKAQDQQWIPVVKAIQRGIPSQYPNSPIPASAEIENIQPVRIALLRSIYGNVSAVESLTTACAILDELVRPCNSSRWVNDSRCVNPVDGQAGCQVGQKLHSDHLGIISCRACESGSFQEERSVSKVCQACPSGRFASVHGSSTCEQCSYGMVASAPGQTACFNCSAGEEPFSSKSCRSCSPGTYQDGFSCVACPSGLTSPSMSPSLEYCFPKTSLIWFNLAIVLDFIALVLLLPFFCGRSVAVHDIFLDEGKLILKTWGSHLVSKRSPLPIKIRLTDTSHYLLEDKSFCVKWRDPEELYLLNLKGQHISLDINTSRGKLHVLPQCALWGRSLCGVHLAVVLTGVIAIFSFCLFFVLQNRQGEVEHLPWALSVCICGGIMASLGGCCVHKSQMKTPLLRRRQTFQQRLSKAHVPEPTERGPDRGIMAEKMVELFDYFRDYIGRRDMHYVTNNLLIPFTEPYRLSYSEVCGPSRAIWFVSHCWSNSFEDFIQSLRKMAEGKAYDEWRWVSFWICSFSNNQFMVKEELGDGDPLKSSFYLALQSPECQGTAMVLDSDCVPLTRSWCLFELLQTRYAPKARASHEGLLLCTPTGVLQWGHAHVDTVVRLAEKVGDIRLEDAQASRLEDKIMIDACVISTVDGGFAEVNRFAKESIKTVLDEANGSFQLRVQELMLRLDHEGSPPRLLGRGCEHGAQKDPVRI